MSQLLVDFRKKELTAVESGRGDVIEHPVPELRFDGGGFYFSGSTPVHKGNDTVENENSDLVFSSLHTFFEKEISDTVLKQYAVLLIDYVQRKALNMPAPVSILMVFPDTTPESILRIFMDAAYVNRTKVLIIRGSAFTRLFPLAGSSLPEDFWDAPDGIKTFHNDIELGCLNEADEFISLMPPDREPPFYIIYNFLIENPAEEKKSFRLVLVGKIGESYFECESIQLPGPERRGDSYYLHIDFKESFDGLLTLQRNNRVFARRMFSYPSLLYTI